VGERRIEPGKGGGFRKKRKSAVLNDGKPTSAALLRKITNAGGRLFILLKGGEEMGRKEGDPNYHLKGEKERFFQKEKEKRTHENTNKRKRKITQAN